MIKITGFYIRTYVDTEVLSECFWIIAFFLEIPDNREKRIAEVTRLDVFDQMVVHLSHTKFDIYRPILRAFGQLAMAHQNVVSQFCTPNFAERLICCLYSSKAIIRFDACWTISNLICTNNKILDLFACPATFNQLIEITLFDGEIHNSNEAISCLHAFTTNADITLVENLLTQFAIVSVIMRCLERESVSVILSALKCLETLLIRTEERRTSTQSNHVVILVMEGAHYGQLEQLATISNAEIAFKAQALIEEYFPTTSHSN